ncbi:MAG: acetyl-CoA carboxylase carboxyl transferase subunit alpha [Rhodospirillaceae bacterium]|nr:acetyl-CoA carboxylase carboxyl transferase subunit alpha [Rhodospirillaceae bacterium]MDG1274780.1 acetyl-CoA carboxylase carboxyltransferase subunit alpha [Alphaproteobacteria bacterium]MDG1886971.1 acetyl-CoA carboxylase carboxyltransferase subunit alpha [Alphaproteobacteria bacterium]
MFLDFEKQVAEFEGKIEELRHISGDGDTNIATEITKLQIKAERQLKTIYEKLSPWQKVQVARHPNRPHFKEVIKSLFSDFINLAGDRSYGEDKAINAGLARFRNQSVMIIGTEKGNTTQERLETNFGMAMPEGYRKAKRLMEMADRFNLPILTFIDTAGAYPGIGAEERGQAEAIARSIETSLSVNVPIVAVILGEGGSGGAVALATADKVLMLEHSIYSVISPEGCASILWRSSENATNAANALRLTAQDLYSLNIIDSIIKEPLGAAHRDHQTTMTTLGDAIESSLKDLLSNRTKNFRENRRKKFIAMTDNKLI